jgi:hypothetical protein
MPYDECLLTIRIPPSMWEELRPLDDPTLGKRDRFGALILLGLGEAKRDRATFLGALASFREHQKGSDKRLRGNRGTP